MGMHLTLLRWWYLLVMSRWWFVGSKKGFARFFRSKPFFCPRIALNHFQVPHNSAWNAGAPSPFIFTTFSIWIHSENDGFIIYLPLLIAISDSSWMHYCTHHRSFVYESHYEYYTILHSALSAHYHSHYHLTFLSKSHRPSLLRHTALPLHRYHTRMNTTTWTIPTHSPHHWKFSDIKYNI